MRSVHRTDGSSYVGLTGVESFDSSSNATHLREPDLHRQGDLPAQKRTRWNPFSGRIIAGATMAVIVAASLPFMTGGSLAQTRHDPTVVEVGAAERQVGQTTMRGQFVEAPVPGGGASGLWLVPLKNQPSFDVDGARYDRLYIGVLGSDATGGLTPGGVGDLSGTVLQRIYDGAVVGVVDAIDGVVAGLPRDMQGAVRLGAAPGSAPGSDADHMFLVLDSPIWLNGKKVDVVHLGALGAASLSGLEAGDQVTIGGRVDAGEHGARLVSASSIAATHYAGSEVRPPVFDGVSFRPAGAAGDDATLPAIDLGSGAHGRRDVVVVDAESGVAHLGSVARRAGSERFEAALPVQAFLQGGPTFEAGALEPRLTWVEHGAEGDTHHGWYLHEASNTLYLASFEIDADGRTSLAQATLAVGLDAEK